MVIVYRHMPAAPAQRLPRAPASSRGPFGPKPRSSAEGGPGLQPVPGHRVRGRRGRRGRGHVGALGVRARDKSATAWPRGAQRRRATCAPPPPPRRPRRGQTERRRRPRSRAAQPALSPQGTGTGAREPPGRRPRPDKAAIVSVARPRRGAAAEAALGPQNEPLGGTGRCVPDSARRPLRPAPDPAREHPRGPSPPRWAWTETGKVCRGFSVLSVSAGLCF